MYFGELVQVVLQKGDFLFLGLATRGLVLLRVVLLVLRLLHSRLQILHEQLPQVVQSLKLLGL